MKLANLSPNLKNPRKITDEKLAMLKKSIDEFGDLGAIVYNEETGTLVGGHQRLKVLPPDADIVITQEYDVPTRTGTTAEGHVVIAGEKFKYRRVSWDAQKETAAMISANRQGGEWDFPVLSELLLDLDNSNYDMELTGYDDQELEKQLTYVSAHTRNLVGSDDDKTDVDAEDEKEKEQIRVVNIQIPEIINGDCLEVLKTLDANKYDSMVTDPPAGISFMGKAWDDDKGGSKQWIAWMKEVMQECLRVLKPGAHALVWAIPRTSHWTATALEDAGFEIRDVVTHLFGSGFPKSLDISKAIDKMNGDERPVVGSRVAPDIRGGKYVGYNGTHEIDITSAASAASAAWEGWGTSLKPASEHWILVRKPCSEDTVAKNVLAHGTGGINIEASRIGNEKRVNTSASASAIFGSAMQRGPSSECVGRFPANLVLSHNDDCKLISEGKRAEGKRATTDFASGEKRERDFGPTYDEEIPEQWACTPDCAVATLDGQSGQFAGVVGAKQLGKYSFHAGGIDHPDKAMEGGVKDFGGASRFFYCSKPSKREKNAGCDGIATGVKAMSGGAAAAAARGETSYESDTASGYDKIQFVKNIHPTVKPIKLMTYFIKMVTPPGGTVLDPFCGSGTTGVAAGRHGFKFLGIEKDPQYAQIASHRFQHEMTMTDDELEGSEGEEEAEIVVDGDHLLDA